MPRRGSGASPGSTARFIENEPTVRGPAQGIFFHFVCEQHVFCAGPAGSLLIQVIVPFAVGVENNAAAIGVTRSSQIRLPGRM